MREQNANNSFLGHALTCRRLLRGSILTSLAIVAITVIAMGSGHAQGTANSSGQTYPSKPIRLVVATAAGGSPDVAARWIAQKLSELLGVAVVIENRGGAGGKIAYEIVARASPDGHTLLLVTNAFVLMTFQPDLTFDTVKDFAPIARVATAPTVLVARPGLGFKTVKDLIAYARKNPGKLTFASLGTGSTPHLYAEMLMVTAGINMLHVPYKGSAPAMVDLIAGRLDTRFLGYAAALPFIKAGQVVVLGSASKERSQSLPDLPSLHEQGVTGFDGGTRQGISTTARTPPAVIAKLHQSISRIMAMPETRKTFDDAGLETTISTPVEFDAWIKSQIAYYQKIIQATGIKFE